MIVTQHSGDGKANQYFLRGFNLDHGTDFATSVAGMPVNMPTNAHGQGYTDLNFLIPELVSRIDYRKGPYFAADGDFAPAGSADIVYAARCPRRSLPDVGRERLSARRRSAARPSLAPGLQLIGVSRAECTTTARGTVPEAFEPAQRRAAPGRQAVPAQGWSATLMGYRRALERDRSDPAAADRRRQLQRPAFGRFDSPRPDRRRRDPAAPAFPASGTDRPMPERTRIAAYAIGYRLELLSELHFCARAPARAISSCSRRRARSTASPPRQASRA